MKSERKPLLSFPPTPSSLLNCTPTSPLPAPLWSRAFIAFTPRTGINCALPLKSLWVRHIDVWVWETWYKSSSRPGVFSHIDWELCVTPDLSLIGYKDQPLRILRDFLFLYCYQGVQWAWFTEAFENTALHQVMFLSIFPWRKVI